MKITTSLCSYLCVDYRSHPKLFGWSWNRQHSPQEHQYGQDQWYDRGTDHIIQHYDEIADQLRVGWQQVVHGKQHLQQTVLAGEKLSALFQLLDQKLPAETRGCSAPHVHFFIYSHEYSRWKRKKEGMGENTLKHARIGLLRRCFWHTASLQYNHCLWLSLTSWLSIYLSPSSSLAVLECLPCCWLDKTGISPVLLDGGVRIFPLLLTLSLGVHWFMLSSRHLRHTQQKSRTRSGLIYRIKSTSTI